VNQIASLKLTGQAAMAGVFVPKATAQSKMIDLASFFR
jgi:hypothetical protein